MRSVPYAVLILLLVLPLSFLAGCGSETETAPKIRLPDGVNNVLPLGLDINPKDQALYVRTDKGTFRVGRDARQATALEAELQTTLARIPLREDLTFAFVGPDQLVGSGHPAEKGSAPENLGLLSSQDGGATWTSVTLLGEADLHPVRPRGSQLIAYDISGGRMVVFGDYGQRVRRQKSPGLVVDMAIDPSDPQRVVAATSNGPLVSTNTAKTWRPLGNGDAAYFAWQKGDELYFVDGVGQLFVSPDGGQTGQPLGRIRGEPRGLAVTADGTLWAVTKDLAIHRSRDTGKTWAKFQLAARDA